VSDKNEIGIQFMIDFLIGEVSGYIAKDCGISVEDAMSKFYGSKTCERLFNRNTLLYREGPGYLYEFYKDVG
jgi:hypothetical protein